MASPSIPGTFSWAWIPTVLSCFFSCLSVCLFSFPLIPNVGTKVTVLARGASSFECGFENRVTLALNGFCWYKGMWRNKEWETYFLFSVICSNVVVSDHNKFIFGLVLVAYSGREMFSTLDVGICPVGLPGPTHNLLGLLQSNTSIIKSLGVCALLHESSIQNGFSLMMHQSANKRQIPEPLERKKWWGQGW